MTLYLPTEPNIVLSVAARAFALAAVEGPLSAVGDRPAASGEAQGRRPWGSDRPVQASPTSNALDWAWP